MARNLGGFFVGFVVVFLVVSVLQFAGQMMYPLPEGMDPFAPDFAESFAAHVQNMPLGAWILAFASEVVGAFLGALAAGTIAGSRKHVVAGFVVGLAQVGSLMNWFSFPHPLWFMVGQVLAYVLVYLAVSRLVGSNGEEQA